MMKQFAQFILAFILVFAWTAPSFGFIFGKNKCQELFTIDLEPIYRAELKQLISTHYSFEQKESIIGDLFLKFGLRQFKLKSMEASRDIRRAVSETEHLFQVGSKFTGEYHALSPEMRWLERETLSRGIDTLVLKYRDVPESHAVLRLIRKILKSRLVQFAQNFRHLPYRSDKVVPQELFEDIMRDGPIAHEARIKEFYDSTNQDRIDGYRHIRKIYSTFFILLLSYTTWDQLNTIDEKVNRAKLVKTLEGLEDLLEFQEALDQELARRNLYKD